MHYSKSEMALTAILL